MPAGSGSEAGASASTSDSMNTWSIGKSMKVGPDGGVSAAASASSTSAGIAAVASAVRASLVTGATNGT